MQGKKRTSSHKIKRLARVIAFPSANRPEDVISRIREAAATGHLAGIAVGMTFSDGRSIDLRVFGEITHGDLVWIGARLQQEGLEV